MALSDQASTAKEAAEVLKTQVFLYEADMEKLETAFNDGNEIARRYDYAEAEFFTKLPEVSEKIEVVTYVAGEGDISTDLLSPGNQAHSRSDRELHGKCMISVNAQNEIKALQNLHPDKSVMLLLKKERWALALKNVRCQQRCPRTENKQSPYVPFVNIFPIVAGTNGISPIFLTTVSVTGGIGIDLKNWVKKSDEEEILYLIVMENQF